MAQETMYAAKVNSPETTLASGIDDSATTIALADASVLPAGPNLAVLGTGEDAETVLYTAKDGNSLTGCTRGKEGTAASWPAGTAVARRICAYDHDTFKANVEDHETRIVGHPAFFGRNAVINGNFDVWQRGTQTVGSNIMAACDRFSHDRWQNNTVDQIALASAPTTTGHPGNSRFIARWKRTNPESGYPRLWYIVENKDTIPLRGKTVTLSALIYICQSDSSPLAADDKFGLYLRAHTGTADTLEHIETGMTVVASGSYDHTQDQWQLLTATGVVPETANNLAIHFFTNEGNNNLHFASQVQLCAGSVALDYQPRSFAEELVLCQRYYQRHNASDGAAAPFCVGSCMDTDTVYGVFPFSEMRSAPSVTFASAGCFNIRSGGVDETVSAINTGSVRNGSALIIADIGAAALTPGYAAILRQRNGAGSDAYIALDAEI